MGSISQPRRTEREPIMGLLSSPVEMPIEAQVRLECYSVACTAMDSYSVSGSILVLDSVA